MRFIYKELGIVTKVILVGISIPVDETEETDGELEAYYAYQLLKIRPSIIQVLALPYEYLVVFEKDKIKAILDDNDVDVWNGVTN